MGAVLISIAQKELSSTYLFLSLHEIHLGFHVAHARYVQLNMCSLLHVMMQEKEIIIKIIIYLFKVGMMKIAKRTN